MVDQSRLPPERPSRARAQADRDRTLMRLSAARRWMLGAAAALSAGFAALVAVVAPGKSYGARKHPAAATRATSSSGPQMPPLAAPSQLGLQGPSAAPGPVSPASSSVSAAPAAAPPTPAQAPPVSGGS